MRLSAAIRLGATLGPQCKGVLFDGNKSCAFGAAYLAIGKRKEDIDCNRKPRDYVPEWSWVEVDGHCPICRQLRPIMTIIAACLNDRHEWTRERIADWVETMEPKGAPNES